jgi:hypothetical protein
VVARAGWHVDPSRLSVPYGQATGASLPVTLAALRESKEEPGKYLLSTGINGISFA